MVDEGGTVDVGVGEAMELVRVVCARLPKAAGGAVGVEVKTDVAAETVVG